MRRPALLVGLVAAAALILKRGRAQRAEQDVWKEASEAPDLR